MKKEMGASSHNLVTMIREGQISAEEAGATVISIEASPKPSKKVIHCGFGHAMRYGNYDYPFISNNGKLYFAPSIPAYMCDSCNVKILPKEVGDELIEKVTAINTASETIPQS